MEQGIKLGLAGRKLTKDRLKWNKLLFWFSFFMAFPVIVLVQNISIFIFVAIVFFLLQNSKLPVFSLRKPIQWIALFFGIGAILSVLNMPGDYALDSTERALIVLPNYLYWMLLIILMVTNRHLLDLNIIYKAVFWGTILLIIYFLVFQQYLKVIPIFNRQSSNSFAFLMICFAPISVQYLSEFKSRKWALLFLMILVLVLLYDGRRAGMVLVLLGGLATLFLQRINFKSLFIGAALIGVSVLVVFTETFERYILGASERIYEMIYETGNIQKEDRSYLIRVAMINKGIAIYEKYPYTGIGLNNFSNYTAVISGDFEGSKYVINKEGLNEKSAHNSYVSVLAEGGLFLLIPLLLLLASNILYFLFNFRRMDSRFYPVFIALIAVSVHFYFISAIVNVYAWFLIGLASALHYRKC